MDHEHRRIHTPLLHSLAKYSQAVRGAQVQGESEQEPLDLLNVGVQRQYPFLSSSYTVQRATEVTRGDWLALCLLLPLLEHHPFTARVRPVQVTAAQHGHRRKHTADAVHILRRVEEVAKAKALGDHRSRLIGHWHNQRGQHSFDHMKHACLLRDYRET
jgi:hypothetical protein